MIWIALYPHTLQVWELN